MERIAWETVINDVARACLGGRAARWRGEIPAHIFLRKVEFKRQSEFEDKKKEQVAAIVITRGGED